MPCKNDHLQNELKQFYRKIKLRAHFGINEDRTDPTEEQIFKKTNKTWEPKDVHYSIKTFCDVGSHETQTNLNNLKNRFKNLPQPELKAIKELQNRDDIIITNADKGGAVVIMDVTIFKRS